MPASGTAPSEATVKGKRISSAVLVVAFLAGIALPECDPWLRSSSISSRVEFRSPKPRPEMKWDRKVLERYPGMYEDWYGDSFGFRDKLLRWHNELKWFTLETSPTDQLIRGEDGWLFATWGQAVENHCGLIPFAEWELALWRKRLELRRDWLARQGIEFLYVWVPNKAELYPEHVPARFARVGPSRREQLMDYMRQHSDVRVLDLMAALEEEKRYDTADDHVFFRLGTHWTERGVLAGYRAVARELGLHPRRESDFRLQDGPGQGDSWAGRMYLSDVLTQTHNVLVPAWRRPVAESTDEAAGPNARFWTHEDQSLPRAVVFHDSFGPSLNRILSEHFSRLAAYWQAEFDAEVVERERPAVVVQMYVERALVTRAPGIAGRDAEGWLRERFEGSDDVLCSVDYRRRPADIGDALKVDGETRVAFVADPDPMNAGLSVETVGRQDLLYLPAFEFPRVGSLVLRLEITSPKRTALQLAYMTTAQPTYRLSRTLSVQLQEGYNEILLNLAAPDMTGELLVRPGVDAGRFVLHSLEVRGIED